MYIDKPAGCQFAYGRFRFYKNGSHMTIRDNKTNEVLWSRTVGEPGWYDDEHQALIDACAVMEGALESLVKKMTLWDGKP